MKEKVTARIVMGLGCLWLAMGVAACHSSGHLSADRSKASAAATSTAVKQDEAAAEKQLARCATTTSQLLDYRKVIACEKVQPRDKTAVENCMGSATTTTPHFATADRHVWLLKLVSCLSATPQSPNPSPEVTR